MSEPVAVCVVCHKRKLTPSRAQVCVGCETHLGQLLTEIQVNWPKVFERGRHTNRGSNGILVTVSPEPPVPIDLGYFDLTAPARTISLAALKGPDQIGHLPVATELDGWVKDWAEHLDQDLPDNHITALAGWLHARLPWACAEHEAINLFAADLRRITAVVRRRADETDDRIPIGHCPAVRNDRECGAPLKASPWLDIIECPHCHTRWPRQRWLILAAANHQDRIAA